MLKLATMRPAATVAVLLLSLASVARAQAPALVDLAAPAPRDLLMGAFQLDAPTSVRIVARGAPREAFQQNFIARVVRGLNIEIGDQEDTSWPANAWIIDAASRKVVWDLSDASGERKRNGIHVFDGSVRLPAGAYEVYYATSAPSYHYDDGRPIWQDDDEEFVEQLGITIRAAGRSIAGPSLQRLREAARADVVIALTGARDETNARAGFELTRPTEVEIEMIGEADRNDDFDYGWLIDADSRQKIWRFSYDDSRSAGGARKNRIARERVTLPAGRYAALYVTDDSHSPEEWNAAPPSDPFAWGMFIRVPDAAARASIRKFEYETLPRAQTVLALRGVRDEETRSGGFTLTRDARVRIYALGEGSSSDMDDYGWIIDADTREIVWEMEYRATEHAGGASKNRLFDGPIQLPAGNYEVHYVTDGSHSYNDWNSAQPAEGEHWGITVLAANAAERSAFKPYEPGAAPGVIAQIAQVRDDARVRKTFRLDSDADVRIYALGEGDDSEMYDYAWIEDLATGRTVWEMTYGMTEHAGGASKNRMFNGTVHLKAGEYALRYRSDSSHSFGDWNASAPRDAAMWGVTVRKAN